MSCVTIVDEEMNYFCFSCNTTDVAFGPLMWVPGGDVRAIAQAFRISLGADPRTIPVGALTKKWHDFYKATYDARRENKTAQRTPEQSKLS